MKIIHISDLHFGRNSKEVVISFLEDCKKMNPDIVIITGDITQRSKKSQYKKFMAFKEAISGEVLIVPGNHDITFYGIIRRLLFPYHQYKKYVSQELEVEWKNEKIHILGLNSSNPFRIKKGKLSLHQLNLIEKTFPKTEEKNRPLNLLFFHHNFDSQIGVSFHKPLENADQFLEVLKKTSVDILCIGHLHFSNIFLIEKENQKGCLVLHAGTVFGKIKRDSLNSYFLLTIENLKCQVERRVYKNSIFCAKEIFHFDFSKTYEEF